MSGSSVIREYLVSLGFQTDDAGLHRFEEGLKRATETVVEFAVAVEAAAVAVVAGIAKMAEGLDRLYFASQRTGAAVQNIQALGYAASQTGSSVASAQNSMESLAAFLRNNPQGSSFLAGLGVTSKDTALAMEQLGAAFRSMPMYEQHNIAGMLGIDDKTALALRSGEFARFAEEHRQRLRAAGLDTEQAARSSHQYMTELRALGDSFSVLADKIAVALTGRAGVYVRQFREWIESHFQAISNAVTRVADVIFKAAEIVTQLVLSVSEGINEIIDVFTSMDAHSQGLIRTFGLITAAWMLLNQRFLFTPLGMILELGAGILLLWQDYQTWKSGGSSLIDWARWEPDIKKARDFIIWFGGKLDEMASQVGGWQDVLEGFAVFMGGIWAVRVIAALTRVGAAVVAFGASLGTAILGLTIVGAEVALLKGADALAGDVPSHDDIRNDHPTAFGRWLYDNFPALREADNWMHGYRGSNPGGAGVRGGIPANPNADTPDQQKAGEHIFEFWKSKGLSDEAAASEVAAAHRESTFNPGARGDNGQAAGLYQWHPDRRDAILKSTGIDVWTATLDQQLQAAYLEQQQHIDAGAGRAWDVLTKAGSTLVGTGAMVNDFERSADRAGDQAADQSYADAWLRLHQFRASPLFQPAYPAAAAAAPAAAGPSVNSQTTVVVHGSSDPQATGAEVARQQDSVHQKIVRHLEATVQ